MKASDRRILPRTGVSVTVLGLGCAQMGGLYRETTAAEAEAAMEAAWTCGIRYIDTAPYYGYTRSERRVGAMLSERDRAAFTISTKVGRLMVPDLTVSAEEYGWHRPLPFRPRYDYTYDGILRSFEDSQQRLGLPSVDILYVHDIGAHTHGEAAAFYWTQLTEGGGFRALLALREGGGVRAIGLGVNEVEVIREALDVADLDVAMLAGRYTLLDQGGLSLLDACRRRGVGIVVAGPFNSGILAGGDHFDYGSAPADIVARVKGLAALCAEHGVPLPAAALQFAVAHPAVVSCVAGARNATQVRGNVASLETVIAPAFWTALATSGLVAEGAPMPEAA